MINKDVESLLERIHRMNEEFDEEQKRIERIEWEDIIAAYLVLSLIIFYTIRAIFF